MRARSLLVFACLCALFGSASAAQAQRFAGPLCRFTQCIASHDRAHAASNPTSWGGTVPMGPSGGYSPVALQSAYGLSELAATRGAGTTIGIVIANDDPTAESDLNTWRAHYKLPPCTTANGCFRKINDHATQEEKASRLEVSIDTDAVSSLCPQCHIVLVEGASYAPEDLGPAERIAAKAGAKIISNSYGMGEPKEDKGYVSEPGVISDFNIPGVAVVAASGDWAYGDLIYPAAFPFVTAVGGTTLEPEPASSRGWTESVWNEGGDSDATASGCDPYDPKPPWQHDTGCHGRTVADVSALANINYGISIYSTANGGWADAGGTSLSSPLVSAYYALVGEGAGVGGAQWDYSHAAQLNHVTSGGDVDEFTFNVKDGGSGLACTIKYLCDATPGYNGPTGVGTISGAVAGDSSSLSLTPLLTHFSAEERGEDAALSASVNPEGIETSYYFACSTSQLPRQEEGSPPPPGSLTSSPASISGDVATTVQAELPLPAPAPGSEGSYYSCEVIATSAAGTVVDATTDAYSVAGFWQRRANEAAKTASLQHSAAPSSSVLYPSQPVLTHKAGARSASIRWQEATREVASVGASKKQRLTFLCSFSAERWIWRRCHSGVQYKHLHPGHQYLLYVVARNAKGYSQWSYETWTQPSSPRP